MTDQWNKTSTIKVYGNKATRTPSISSFSFTGLTTTKTLSINSTSASSSSSSSARPASNENEPNIAPSFFTVDNTEKENARKKKREPIDPPKNCRPRKDSDTSVLQDSKKLSSVQLAINSAPVELINLLQDQMKSNTFGIFSYIITIPNDWTEQRKNVLRRFLESIEFKQVSFFPSETYKFSGSDMQQLCDWVQQRVVPMPSFNTSFAPINPAAEARGRGAPLSIDPLAYRDRNDNDDGSDLESSPSTATPSNRQFRSDSCSSCPTSTRSTSQTPTEALASRIKKIQVGTPRESHEKFFVKGSSLDSLKEEDNIHTESVDTADNPEISYVPVPPPESLASSQSFYQFSQDTVQTEVDIPNTQMDNFERYDSDTNTVVDEDNDPPFSYLENPHQKEDHSFEDQDNNYHTVMHDDFQRDEVTDRVKPMSMLGADNQTPDASPSQLRIRDNGEKILNGKTYSFEDLMAKNLPFRRSNGIRLSGHRSLTDSYVPSSSSMPRGDVTPGGCFSQNAIEFSTPQTLPKAYPDTSYLKSVGADKTVIDLLRKKLNERRAQHSQAAEAKPSRSQHAFSMVSDSPVSMPGGITRCTTVPNFLEHQNVKGPKLSINKNSFESTSYMKSSHPGSNVCDRLSLDPTDYHIHIRAHGDCHTNSNDPKFKHVNARGRSTFDYEFDMHDGYVGSGGRDSSFTEENAIAYRDESSLQTPGGIYRDSIGETQMHSGEAMNANKMTLQDSQKKKRLQKSKAKSRRLSSAFANVSGCSYDNSLDNSSSVMNTSSSFLVNATTSKNNRRQSQSFRVKDDTFTAHTLNDIAENEEGIQPLGYESSKSTNRKIQSIRPDVFLKQSTVICGNFENGFDNEYPVVSAPSSNNKRVLDVSLSESGALTLQMYLPIDKITQHVQLGEKWMWYPCSPVGYLVTKSWPEKARAIFYYLPKHPLKWNTFESSIPEESQRDDDEMSGLDCSGISCNDDSGIMEVDTEYDHFAALQSPSFSSFVATSEATNHKPIINHILSYLSKEDLTAHTLFINKTWALATYQTLPKMLASFAWGSDQQWSTAKFKDFLQEYSKGKFLSEGACKRVFCISHMFGGFKALSIMDTKDLKERGMELAVQQELEVSMLCSSLVTMNICPNMIKVYSVFQSNYDPSDKLWRLDKLPEAAYHSPSDVRRDVAIPALKCFLKGQFQYICMEFCNGGDIESIVRKKHHLSAESVRSYMFQMCFSLYCGREAISLRHYDVKLLNFFGSTATSSALKVADQFPSQGNSGLHIGFGKHIYNLPAHFDGSVSIVKLADFGTSAVGTEQLNEPITVQQFTTLENTPPEFLLLGSGARQTFAADTFCLGLCFLHLLTGLEPYEELLKDVKCPDYLLTQLSKVWMVDGSGPNIDDPYYIIHEVVQSLDGGDDVELDEEEAETRNVLFHTLYRYLVLLAASPTFSSGLIANELYEHNPVWKVLYECLDLRRFQGDDSATHHHRRRPIARQNAKDAKKISCAQDFERDIKEWSIYQGKNPVMARARQQLALLGPGASDLLDSSLHWDPSQRCSMYDALNHPIFHQFRVDEQMKSPWKAFMHYYRGADRMGHSDGLPIF